MRRDTRFKRPSREDLEARLPSGIFKDSQATVVWNMMLQSDDPSEVCRWFRTYRDSPHCNVPREDLRKMRDAVIAGMRESNKEDVKPRLERKMNSHYPDYLNTWHNPDRTSA